MAVDFERVASAVFNVASNAARFTTIERRLRHWTGVSPAEQPYLGMSEKGGEGRTERGMSNAPVVWTLNYDFYLYVHTSDFTVSPAIELNQLVTAIDRAFSPEFAPDGSITGFNTLGLTGMVIWARIMGRLQTDEGVLDDQAIAILPVEVLAV